jgi:tRNA threonylcarbamoyladenosine biosynthesis protein TsaB
MLVLALDTTTRQGSIALVRDGVVVDEFCGDGAVTHGERLPGDLARVVESNGLRIGDIDLFAVAAGPGSFTGLRIGIAAMQGLALANDRPLAGVSALDAVYDAVRSPNTLPSPLSVVGVWMDAQRGQVFAERYRAGGAIEDATVDLPETILDRWSDTDPPVVFAGDGVNVHQDVIRRRAPHAHLIPKVPALAASVARLAEASTRQWGAMPPDAVRPIYIRRSDAELARDRRA